MVKNTTNTRKKVGLALSGGGWRGMAHIGVLKVLEKNNIPIDFIAGTSAGALMGGLYSYYGNIDQLEEFVLKFGYKDLFKMITDPRLKTGIIKGQKIIKYINEKTNYVNIEDLKIPFSAVASDLVSGKPYYFKKGSLAEAIRTSISIPLLFQPTQKDGMILIDGGATENVPVNCLKEMGAEYIIASNVNSGIFPLGPGMIKNAGNIALVSTRTMLNTLSDILTSQVDFAIESKIPIEKMKIGVGYFLEFIKEKEVIAIGERAAESSIKELKKYLSDKI